MVDGAKDVDGESGVGAGIGDVGKEAGIDGERVGGDKVVGIDGERVDGIDGDSVVEFAGTDESDDDDDEEEENDSTEFLDETGPIAGPDRNAPKMLPTDCNDAVDAMRLSRRGGSFRRARARSARMSRGDLEVMLQNNAVASVQNWPMRSNC